jgi:hypothetical protein
LGDNNKENTKYIEAESFLDDENLIRLTKYNFIVNKNTYQVLGKINKLGEIIELDGFDRKLVFNLGLSLKSKI